CQFVPPSRAAACSASDSSTSRRAPPAKSNGYAPPASSAASRDGTPAAARVAWASSASLRVAYAPTTTIDPPYAVFCRRERRASRPSSHPSDALVDPLALRAAALRLSPFLGRVRTNCHTGGRR